MLFPYNYSGGFAEFFSFFTLGYVVLHILIAIGVHHDATDRAAAGRKLWLVGSQTWTFATLLGGITTAAIYWMVHHSMLARPESSATEDE